MAKKESINQTIARLIRCAFVAANEGDEAKAMSLWNSAIKKGYIPNPKTEKGLAISLKQGLRDRGLLPESNARSSARIEASPEQ